MWKQWRYSSRIWASGLAAPGQGGAALQLRPAGVHPHPPCPRWRAGVLSGWQGGAVAKTGHRKLSTRLSCGSHRCRGSRCSSVSSPERAGFKLPHPDEYGERGREHRFASPPRRHPVVSQPFGWLCSVLSWSRISRSESSRVCVSRSANVLSTTSALVRAALRSSFCRRSVNRDPLSVDEK